MRMRDAIDPNIEIPRESRTSAAPPSLLLEVMRIASSFDSVAFFSRSVLRSRSIRSECFFFAASSSRFACSKSESSPCSPASAPAISISRVEYSREALSTRACASSRAFVRREISSAIASRRAARDLMCPSCRAVPSRWSAIARRAAAILSSSLFNAASALAKSSVD